MEISLSILTMDLNNVNECLKPFKGNLNYLHLDVMDGKFVPNSTFNHELIKTINKDYIFDTHLMIEEPIKYIKDYAEAGSDYITFHVEAAEDSMACINLIKSLGVKAGISIKPNTPVSEIHKYLPYLDMVLVMSVEPGFGGQKFMESSINKVKELKELKEQHGYNYLINIDGGIKDATLPLVKEYLDLAVSGSYIANAEDPLRNLNILKNM